MGDARRRRAGRHEATRHPEWYLREHGQMGLQRPVRPASLRPVAVHVLVSGRVDVRPARSVREFDGRFRTPWVYLFYPVQHGMEKVASFGCPR
jgi:hypothetical protein